MTRLNFQFSNLLGTVYRQGNLVFSPDGSTLYSAVGNRVSGFDLVRSQSFTFPFEARRNITRLALSPDGAILLAIDDEGHLLMANVVRRVVIHHLNLKKPIADARFSPDGKWVAFAVGRLVQVWATPALERSFTPFALHKTLGGAGDDILCLAWSPDSLFLASGGKDMSVRVHSVHKLPGYAPPACTGHRSSVRACFFGPDGDTLYAVTRDGALSVWEVVSRPDAEPKDVMAFRHAAVAEGGAGRGEARIGTWWQLSNRHYFDKDHARVTSAVLHAPTQVLIIGFQTGVFALYELPGGGRADAATLIPDADTDAATGTAGGTAGGRSAGSSQLGGGALDQHARGGRLVEIHALSISEARVDACAVSPTGEWLAFGCAALGQLLVWEWQSESYVLKQQGHYFAEVNALAYSPGGTVIATAGGDAKVKLWSPSSGFCFVTFTGVAHARARRTPPDLRPPPPLPPTHPHHPYTRPPHSLASHARTRPPSTYAVNLSLPTPLVDETFRPILARHTTLAFTHLPRRSRPRRRQALYGLTTTLPCRCCPRRCRPWLPHSVPLASPQRPPDFPTALSWPSR